MYIYIYMYKCIYIYIYTYNYSSCTYVGLSCTPLSTTLRNTNIDDVYRCP